MNSWYHLLILFFESHASGLAKEPLYWLCDKIHYHLGIVLPLLKSLHFVFFNKICYLNQVPMGRIRSYVQSVIIIIFVVLMCFKAI